MIFAAGVLHHVNMLEVVRHPWFISAVSGFIGAQVLKLIIAWWRHRTWNFRELVSAGGMPSSHSAFVAALACAVGFTDGFDEPYAMIAGAAGVLSPLWLSTWNLSGFSGVFDVRDPNGLITYAKGARTVKTENLGGGVVRTWYVQLSDADIKSGANKYLKTTAELGLAKAITDNSVVKIGDFAVADGKMSFGVEVGQDEVAKAAILKNVEISEALDAGWRTPDADEIEFDETKHEITVTPKSKADPSQKPEKSFTRVRLTEDRDLK